MEVGGHLVCRGDRDAAEVDPHAGALGLAQYLFDKALHSGAGGAAGRGGGVASQGPACSGPGPQCRWPRVPAHRGRSDSPASSAAEGISTMQPVRRQAIHLDTAALQIVTTGGHFLQAGIPILGPRDHRERGYAGRRRARLAAAPVSAATADGGFAGCP